MSGGVGGWGWGLGVGGWGWEGGGKGVGRGWGWAEISRMNGSSQYPSTFCYVRKWPDGNPKPSALFCFLFHMVERCPGVFKRKQKEGA